MRYPVMVFLALLLLAGCGTKLSPMTAAHEIAINAEPNRALAARVGESLLKGVERFGLPSFEPVFSGAPPVPVSASGVRFEPGGGWVVCGLFDDGTLLLGPPAGMLPQGVRLGLRVDRDGRVAGHRPWFDRTSGRRVSQPFWGPFRRAAFRPGEPVVLDEFVFGLTYRGMDGQAGLLERIEFKRTGTRGDRAVEVRVRERDTVPVHGLGVTVFRIYPDHIRYIIEE